MRKQIGKSAAVLALAFALALGALPVSAAAAEGEHWAKQAVDWLNAVYKTDLFVASDDHFTVSEAEEFVRGVLAYEHDNVNGVEKSEFLTGSSGEPLTRGEACVLIYAMLQLPARSGDFPSFSDCQEEGIQRDAIGRLQELGVAGGYPDGRFGIDDPCSDATFATLLCRALRQTGNMESRLPMFVPGEYGQFETMYLGARSCLPFDDESGRLSNILEDGFNASFDVAPGNNSEGESGYYVNVDTKEEVVNAWKARLDWCVDIEEYHITSSGPLGITYDIVSDGVLDAIVQIVDCDRERITDPFKRGLFHDVDPSNWAYNGVMYIVNSGVISGNGDGAVMVDVPATEGTALTIYGRINGSPHPDAVKYPNTPENPMWSDGPDATRAYTAYISANLYEDYDPTKVNPSVLDRFTDRGDISNEDYEKALAYLVSVGAIGGMGDGSLAPRVTTDRAMMMVIFQRVLYGLDTTKMNDYANAVEYALGEWGAEQ